MQTKHKAASVTQRAANGSILIVDDNADLVRGLRTLLENDGYGVHILPNGASVAEAVALHRPDLVVLDVMMPVVDGWEALRRIRENPANERLPVMMLTAKGTEDAKVHGFTLGADDYLSKPFSVREFRCRVEALLRRARPADSAQAERIPVVSESGTEFVSLNDVVYVEGVRNYAYIYTYDARFLGRMSLGAIEAAEYPGFMRVHRSYIVRLAAVKGYHWANKSSFRLVLKNAEGAVIPVSRTLVTQTKQRVNEA
ncbi:MAG: response regulator [Actinobacteria bacterium]|nr:response regulator [Actinomycetota bacterium]MCG2807308.1 response regulator [Coriobacteriia bacterium]